MKRLKAMIYIEILFVGFFLLIIDVFTEIVVRPRNQFRSSNGIVSDSTNRIDGNPFCRREISGGSSFLREEWRQTFCRNIFDQPEQRVHLPIDHREKRDHSSVGLIGMFDGRSEFISNVPIRFAIFCSSAIRSECVRLIEFPHVLDDRIDFVFFVGSNEHQLSESFDELWQLF